MSFCPGDRGGALSRGWTAFGLALCAFYAFMIILDILDVNPFMYAPLRWFFQM